jgi:peptidoglycan/LPS O-acetylase OafA/YrhL
MVVVLIVSCLSHRWVEKPLQNLVLRLPELLRSSGLRKPERAQAAA